MEREFCPLVKGKCREDCVGRQLSRHYKTKVYDKTKKVLTKKRWGLKQEEKQLYHVIKTVSFDTLRCSLFDKVFKEIREVKECKPYWTEWDPWLEKLEE